MGLCLWSAYSTSLADPGLHHAIISSVDPQDHRVPVRIVVVSSNLVPLAPQVPRNPTAWQFQADAHSPTHATTFPKRLASVLSIREHFLGFAYKLGKLVGILGSALPHDAPL